MAAVAPPPGLPATNPSSAIANQRAPPSQSLYIQNLPEKLQKDDLRRALYMLFSTYGPVIDVTALKTPRMRGQAHVLFKDVNGATQAMRACAGMDFFGREMRISYSRNRSNTLAKLTGTFNQPQTTEQPKGIPLPGQAPSSFPAPPGALQSAPPPGLPQPPASLPGPPSSLPPPPGLPPPAGLPAKVNGEAPGLKAPAQEPEDVASPQGVKRQREESDSESESEASLQEATMEEDEDDDEGAMEMSEDEEDDD